MLEFIRARFKDVFTSKEAADSVKRFDKEHYELILKALKDHGHLGKSGIAKASGLDDAAVSRRLGELQKLGLIELTGEVVLSASKRKEREWKLKGTN
jgi:CRP-like cAMP-binding protein